MPHDGNTFLHVVCSVAVNLRTGSVGILAVAGAGKLFQLAGLVVVLGLYIGKAVDTGNDLGSVLAQSVQDNAERFFTNLVCLLCNTDCTLCRCKGLVACQKREALGIFFQKHLSKISMTKSNLPAVRYGTGNAEGLKSLSDGCSCLGCLAAILLDRDGGAYGVRPFCVFKADRLNILYHMIYIQSCGLCNFSSLFNRTDPVLGKLCQNLFFSSLV